MDDAIIYASTFEELLENVDQVLQSFRKMNIRLSPIKSQFGVTSLKFLGHHITTEGIQPDKSILKTIRDYPWPAEKVHIQRFLGLTNWLRKYVKDYARVAAPLTDLTGNVPFDFGAQQIVAFNELKNRLSEPPILRHPQLDKPFILKTDACRLGFGGILAQKDEATGHEYVVRYGSKRTTGPERNYSATDLECAAVVYFIKKWHVFLAGGRFTLVTDHQALKYLMTAKDLTGRLARWAIKLQEYEFDIVYRKGKEHGDVDALSRAVGQEEESPHPWEQYYSLISEEATPTLQPNYKTTAGAEERITTAAASPHPAQMFYQDKPAQLKNPASSTHDNTDHNNPPITQPSDAPATAAHPTTHQKTEDSMKGSQDDEKLEEVRTQGIQVPSKATPNSNRVAQHEEETTPCEDGPGQGWDETNAAGFSQPNTLQQIRTQPPKATIPHVIISIEGNIGAGKSSVINALQQRLQGSPDFQLLPEPVQEWNQSGALEQFYNTHHMPKVCYERWSAAKDLQIAILDSYQRRMKEWEQEGCPPYLVMERGVWSSLAVFTKAANLHPSMENKVLGYAQETSVIEATPELIIYIDTPPEVCLARIQNRGVEYESDIDLVYLSSLDYMYNSAFRDYTGTVHAVSGLQSKEQIQQQVENIIMQYVNDKQENSPDQDYYEKFVKPYTSLGGTPTQDQHWEYEQHQDEITTSSSTQPHLDSPSSSSIPKKANQILRGGSTWSLMHDQGPATKFPSSTALPVLLSVDTQAIALFQQGPGRLEFSEKFIKRFEENYGYTPNPFDRVDNFAVLNLMLLLGFKESTVPESSPAYALFPRRAMQGLRIRRVPCGAELVEICPELYALRKQAEIGNTPDTQDMFMINGYCLEGGALGTQMKILTSEQDFIMSPAAAAEAQPEEPMLFLFTSASEESEEEKDTQKEHISEEEQRTDSDTTRSPSDTTGSGPPIPVDLPCEVCNSPEDWPHMLICSTCVKGFHTYCLGINRVPQDAWDCPDCKKAGKQPMRERTTPPPSLADPEDDTRNEDYSTQEQTNVQHEDDDDGMHPEDINSSLDIYKDYSTLFYLQNEAFPATVHDLGKEERVKEMRRIKKRATKYKWYEDVLYKRKDKAYHKDRVVPEPQDRVRIVQEVHNDMGHLGVNKVMSLISQRFYFKNMREIVAQELKKCDGCARKKADFKKDPELHPLPPLPSFKRFCMDTLGPLPRTPRGNAYIVVAIDHFTKFMEAKAIPAKKAADVARFTDEIICRYLPSIILTDNGSEFKGQFRKILKHRGVQHTTSTAYRPQSNGMAERSVQSILNALQKIAVEHPTDWDDHLPEVLMGLRAAKQSTTEESPYYLAYGVHPAIASELKRQTPQAEEEEATAGLPHVVHQQLLQRTEEMNTTATRVVANIEKAHEQQKKAYRRRRGLEATCTTAQRMPPGSLILMDVPHRGKKKFSQPEGPYKINTYSKDMTSALLEDANGKKWWTSSHRLAPYTPNQPHKEEPPQTKRRL
jgi:thymidylate kinase/transposase InsO family protein